MEIVYGGTKEGIFLTSHPIVKSIHLTGSTATYDAVVWGKTKKVPLTSPFHAEVEAFHLLSSNTFDRHLSTHNFCITVMDCP